MVSVVHFLAGAAVGTILGSWPIALTVSVCLHLLFDMLPHVDPGTLKLPEERGSIHLTDLVLVTLDLTICFGLLLLLAEYGKLTPGVFAGVAGGVLPDLPSGLYSAWPAIKQDRIIGWYYRFNRRLQGTVDKKDWARGLLPELAIVLISILILLKSS